jgi:hypothetical protein
MCDFLQILWTFAHRIAQSATSVPRCQSEPPARDYPPSKLRFGGGKTDASDRVQPALANVVILTAFLSAIPLQNCVLGGPKWLLLPSPTKCGDVTHGSGGAQNGRSSAATALANWQLGNENQSVFGIRARAASRRKRFSLRRGNVEQGASAPTTFSSRRNFCAGGSSSNSVLCEGKSSCRAFLLRQHPILDGSDVSEQKRALAQYKPRLRVSIGE